MLHFVLIGQKGSCIFQNQYKNFNNFGSGIEKIANGNKLKHIEIFRLFFVVGRTPGLTLVAVFKE